MKKKKRKTTETFYLQNIFFQKRLLFTKVLQFLKNPNYIFNNRVSNKIELYIQQFFPTYIIYIILGLK